MKKSRFYGIMFALLLIAGGLTGFSYLIKIGGAGPGASWGLAMGPVMLGVTILIILVIPKGKKKSPYISPDKESV